MNTAPRHDAGSIVKIGAPGGARTAAGTVFGHRRGDLVSGLADVVTSDNKHGPPMGDKT
jgi:hypothetical protein